jgi:hypothetical protein
MVKVLEVESSLNVSYKRGDRIKEGAFLGLRPDLNGAVFSPFAGKIKSVTFRMEKQVVSIAIEKTEDTVAS